MYAIDSRTGLASTLVGLAIAAATLGTVAPAGPALAAPPAPDTISPMVAVPDYGNGGLSGCYRIQGTLYGPYRMSFCLNPRGNGTYQVTGGGLSCNGSLDWYDSRNGRVAIDLYRSPCGRGEAWSGDGLSCRVDNWRPVIKVPGAKVVVPLPDRFGPPPSYNSLNCTYNPVAGGYRPIQVTASRI